MANPTEVLDINAEYFKLKQEGNKHFGNDEVEKAKECYLKAIECVPSPTKEVLELLHDNLSAIYCKEENWGKVLEHACLALELNPENETALFSRYRALETTGKVSEALDSIINLCCLKLYDPMYIKALDAAIMRAAEIEGEELIKNRVPSPLSKLGINTYLKSLESDVVAKWWRGEQVHESEDLAFIRQSLNQQSLQEGSGDGSTKNESTYSGFMAALVDLNSQNYSNIFDHCTDELSRAESKFKAEAHLLRGTFRYLWGYSEADVLEDLDPITTCSLPASTELRTSAWMKRGELFALTKNILEMRKSFEEAQSLSPDCPDVYSVFCSCLMELDQNMEAYIQISKAVDKCPDNPATIGLFCFLKFQVEGIHGNSMAPIEAVEKFQVYVARFPKSVELLVAFGYFFKQVHEPCAGYIQFEKAYDLDPENINLAVNKIMMIFESTLKSENCLAGLKALLAKDENNPAIYEALATIYVSSEADFDLALEAVQKGIQVSKARHDFLTFAVLKKTAEVRKKVVITLSDARYDPFRSIL